MKKLLLSLLFFPIITYSVSNKDIDECDKKEDKNERQQCLLLLKKQVNDEAIAWDYSVREDKMRHTKKYLARKFSDEIKLGDKENIAILFLSFDEKGQESIYFAVNGDERSIKCFEPCQMAWRFDDQKIVEAPILPFAKAGAMLEPKRIKEFSDNLKNSDKLIIELPTNTGNTQYEFTLKPKVSWEHF